MIFEFLLMYLIILVIIFSNFKHSSSNVIVDFLSKDYADALKGIAILMIVCSHWANYCIITGSYGFINKILILIIVKWGIIGVGIFFFLSGYGLSVSKKGPQNISFILERILKIYVPCVIIRFVYYVIITHTSFEETLLFVFSFKNPFWFINVLLLFYFAYWILSQIRVSEKWWLFAVFILGLNIIFIKLGFNEQWWNANFCFAFGILLAEKEASIFKIYSYKWKIVFFIGIIGTVGGMCFNIVLGDILPLLLKTFMLFFIVIMLIGLLIKFTYKGRKLAIIGRESLYIYIVHLLVLKYFKQNILLNDLYYHGVLYFTVTTIMCMLVILVFKRYSAWLKSVRLVKKNEDWNSNSIL